MILQALVKRYKDSGGINYGWQTRPADYALEINSNGDILSLTSLAQQDGKKNIRRTFDLPEEPQGRTSGIKAAFLCDNASYIFGIDPKRGQEKFQASADYHNEILKTVNTPEANAIKRFFESQKIPPTEISETKNSCLFMVEGKFAQDYPEIAQAWDAYKASSVSDEVVCCLVSGNRDGIAKLHPSVALRGTSMGRVPFISANAESFTSFGKTMSDPAAQIGAQSAFAYATALNDLLKSDTHHKFLADDTLVYWAEEGGEPEAQAFSWALEPKEDDAHKLDALMKAFSAGSQVAPENCKPDRSFYLLCLSPNAGRISVRFFFRDSFEQITKNVLEHYKNMDIYSSSPEKFSYIPPWIILAETTVKGKTQDAAPLLGGQLMNAIITGSPYPMTLYQAILTRVRAGGAVNRTKAAIIKAVLIRNYTKNNNESEVMTVALDPNTGNTAYNLGCLFFVLERLQVQAAGGKLNTTIRDSFFSSGCTNPSSVFPTILRLSAHHISKLGDEAAYLERLKTVILGKLNSNEPFPSALSLDDQGRFILGYYHQKQDYFTSKKEKETEENEND